MVICHARIQKKHHQKKKPTHPYSNSSPAETKSHYNLIVVFSFTVHSDGGTSFINKRSKNPPAISIPIGSMYGRFSGIYHNFKPNVGKYTSPRSCGSRSIKRTMIKAPGKAVAPAQLFGGLDPYATQVVTTSFMVWALLKTLENQWITWRLMSRAPTKQQNGDSFPTVKQGLGLPQFMLHEI